MKCRLLMALSLSAILAAGGCASSKKAGDTEVAAIEKSDDIVEGKMLGGAAVLPQAIIYRTNGDFNDNVPVTLSADRKEIVSYPAPTDLTAESAPLQLADGFLLDRRGIGPNTAFTQYTYGTYRELKAAPSIKVLKESIIGGAEVTEIVQLPMTAGEAAADTARCNSIIRNGLPGCEVLLHRHAIQLTPQ